ncbi:tRNA (guanosine(46)-N7)-methyltransferase TrmB [Zafaria sp. Z1313]|uniref:tRNA (guanosine(46)-N7)-methyltransferase TrmB n=1 Tax=Zafaria sp. Z1313 TaxID=3423202 RepID=UPI003D302204
MSLPEDHKPPVSGRAVQDPSFYRTEPVSFVRRGSRLHGRRAEAWDRQAERFLVDVPRHHADTSVLAGAEFDPAAVFGRTAPLTVEIGSGLGEAVAAAAEAHPERDFLAVEVYRPGLAQLLLRIEQKGLENVRAVQANAPEVLDVLLGPGSVDELWVFFPDPWHKARHHKRRLVKESFADKAARVLAPGATWRLATDWSDYAEQMRSVLDASASFESLHPGELAGDDGPLARVRRAGLEGRDPEPDATDPLGGWAPRYEGRIPTSFESKARKAGRLVFDLAYRRTTADA